MDHGLWQIDRKTIYGYVQKGLIPYSRIESNVRFSKHQVQRWLARAIIRREGGVLVGNIGFHGEPGVNAAGDASALEIGYGILPEHRRQGYATEAVDALVGWARTQGIDHFVASVAPDNVPSLAIIRKLGFVRTGQHIDPEDGLEHVFELRD